MKIVADSGSTKTDWRIITGTGRFEQAESIGLNPNFAADEDFTSAFAHIASLTDPGNISQFWFYGAGCGSEKNRERVAQLAQPFFPASEVFIETDMLGAARSLCGNQPGMAAILGTGMNTCVYDGSNITQNHFSLGYVLGDEGSGAYLGKQLVTAWLKNQLPEDLKRNFDLRFQLSPNDVIEHVYRKPLPNRFLAQFAKFIYQNLKNPFCTELVINGFTSFFREQIKRYPDWEKYQLHLTGSVAFYFGNLLKRVAEQEGVNIGTIVEKPVAALALYHEEN
ncbi:MAG: N-acetylglucosamine kinase [Bacteroidota bacterium]